MVRRLLLAALLLGLARAAPAHDIPDEVRVQAFVKPEGNALRLLVRVPLKAMREVDVPRRSGGFLDLARADGALRDAVALWLSDDLELYENGARLPAPKLLEARVSLESDRSFASYAQALAHFSEPRLPAGTELYWSQGLLDARLEVPIAGAQSDFAIRPRLERLGLKVNTIIFFVGRNDEVRPFNLHGDPGLVHLDPRWHEAALRFVRAGVEHILGGADHLLFLALIVVPYRRLLPLAAIVTAFTVAHSITLIAAALGYGLHALWFPPLVEVLIAASILYMAIENALGSSLRRRWALTLAFGLVHGFGFSYALSELLQFAGSHLVASLLAFNAGIELGQLAALLVFVPILNFILRFVPEKPLTILLSLILGHTAWHWLAERWERLAQFPLPALDAASAASLIRWLMALIVLAAVAWIGGGALQRAVERRIGRP